MVALCAQNFRRRLQLSPALIYAMTCAASYATYMFGDDYKLVPGTRAVLLTHHTSVGYKNLKAGYVGTRSCILPEDKLLGREAEASGSGCADTTPCASSSTLGKRAASSSQASASKRSKTSTTPTKNAHNKGKGKEPAESKPEQEVKNTINLKDVEDAKCKAVLVAVVPQKYSVGSDGEAIKMTVELHKGIHYKGDHETFVQLHTTHRLKVIGDQGRTRVELKKQVEVLTFEVIMTPTVADRYNRESQQLTQFSATPLLPKNLGSVYVTIQIGSQGVWVVWLRTGAVARLLINC